ncbi:DUF3087 domain-containing protein [Alkalimarinus sediminis]|uniref:DUF3087 domain-containing protein n=1 Tax=Alkalimarinus sediminis TaxID=1632866 RepID=A0A9E8KIY8_9ALTE|nr:DUF3087 domain-containing protein [Alkalimarinus sediminis]UZW74421.1 DUF3087 domain-containing protein [Alkalimarinus sediminis]
MQLQPIDKALYRKRLNRVIAAVIVTLMALALGCSTLLIILFGELGGSNFMLNLIGVVMAASLVGLILRRVSAHPYMREVMYVWRLKQELNRIYRNTAKIKAAAETNNLNALIITNFNLKASIQLYELDDNDLTLGELKQEVEAFDAKVDALGLTISTDDYDPVLLSQLD